ncbi:MAG: molybdopterin-dependent oxidoreductase, partial [Rhodospirillales bacterium]|nr:molybdopterin-dependent oxidoreductase [Rhodospirillales bacterium]
MATYKTTCRLCLVRCGINVETQDEIASGAIPNIKAGEITRMIGDRDHPLSKGYLCVKGKASMDIMDSPSRVIYPQKRVGERGSGQWQRVSWDEALDDIAGRLDAIIDEHGASAVATQALPPKDYFVFDLFLKAIGSPTSFKHDSHNCFTPQLISDVLTFGCLTTYPAYYDVDASDVVLLWGINMLETNGSKGVRVREAQRKKGVISIVVDPRPTQSAKEADLWLPIRPGTDAALAMGMINIMISEGWYDETFIADWTLGFDELKARAAQYPVERVAEITWIKAEDIREATHLFATADNSAMYTFIGATMGGNSISTLRLMGFLPALTGRFDTAGNNGFLSPLQVRMPGYYTPAGGASKTHLRDKLGAEKFPLFAGPDAVTTPYSHPRQVIDAMLTGEPYPVRALWTDCNPMIGLEDSYAVRDALKSLDLLVVPEIFESPTAHLADYILPITTHLESDAITEYSALDLISARVRCIEPRGEAREEGEAVIEVLKRMGYGDKMPVSSYRELLDSRLEPMGLTFDEFVKKGSIVGPLETQKYRSGKMRRDGRPGFNTRSGKIEFTSTKLGAHGYDPLPDFVEPPLSPNSDPELTKAYPLILISGTRSVEYYSTLGIEVPRLNKRRPFPGLEMSPETASEHGLAEGDWVRIEAPTTDKTIKRQVIILDGMPEGMVNAEGLWYMPGCDDLVEGTLEVGANVLNPLRDDVDPVIGGSIARCII